MATACIATFYWIACTSWVAVLVLHHLRINYILLASCRAWRWTWAGAHPYVYQPPECPCHPARWRCQSAAGGFKCSSLGQKVGMLSACSVQNTLPGCDLQAPCGRHVATDSVQCTMLLPLLCNMLWPTAENVIHVIVYNDSWGGPLYIGML